MVAQQLNQNKCSGNILELEICVSNYSYDKESEKVTEQLQNVTWELREAESGSMDIKNKDWEIHIFWKGNQSYNADSLSKSEKRSTRRQNEDR